MTLECNSGTQFSSVKNNIIKIDTSSKHLNAECEVSYPKLSFATIKLLKTLEKRPVLSSVTKTKITVNQN